MARRVSREELYYTVNQMISEFNRANGTEISLGHGRITLDQRCTYGADKPVKYDVNWAAIGSVSPEEAEAYAFEMMEAAKLARRLNDLELIEDWNMDGKEFVEKILAEREKANA